MKKTMSNQAVAKRLGLLRRAKGVDSKTRMAALIGATTNQYNNWENAIGQPPVAFAVRIASLTGATLDYIFLGDVSGLPIKLTILLSELEANDARSVGDA
jgi:transcriptional regulator with XRE-family HTH domain